MAANQARMEELLQMTENFDASGLSGQFDRGLAMIREALKSGNRTDVAAALSVLEEARTAEKSNANIWAEFREHLRLDTALIATTHKMRMDERLIIHPDELYEVLLTFQRIFFRVIKDPKDRQWARNELVAVVGNFQDNIEADQEDEV